MKKFANKKILIFEDDVKFIKSIKELKEPPSDWDMIYLGGTVHRVLDRQNKDYPRVQTWTTHAYFVNLENPKLIEDLLKMNEFDGEIDRYYLEKIHPKYKCYMSSPMCCIQSEGYSCKTNARRTMRPGDQGEEFGLVE